MISEKEAAARIADHMRVHQLNEPRAIHNPNIADDSIVNQIRVDFGIRPSDECRIEYDYSNHYKSHLDTGWKEEKQDSL